MDLSHSKDPVIEKMASETGVSSQDKMRRDKIALACGTGAQSQLQNRNPLKRSVRLSQTCQKADSRAHERYSAAACVHADFSAIKARQSQTKRCTPVVPIIPSSCFRSHAEAKKPDFRVQQTSETFVS